jgi:hypothetical protein
LLQQGSDEGASYLEPLSYVTCPSFTISKSEKTESEPLSVSAPAYEAVCGRKYKVSVEHKLNNFMAN